MGRWKPPQPNSSPYITAVGFEALQQESKALWKRRVGVTKALAAAAAEGDRSENAEYIYRKKELREIDRRIRYLQKRIPVLKVVADLPADRSRIFFGAWVTLENQQGEKKNYRIVGADEIESEGTISIDSPLAKALLKKSVDDEVVISNAFGEKRYIVKDIRYES